MPNRADFNHFAYNPVDINIGRSIFNMDHSVKWSCNVGECIPFDFWECLPGDTFSVNTSKVIRLQPLVTPIYDEIIQDVYFFFVPHRLVWNHWINFMGENTESAWTPETEYKVPTITPPEGGFDVGTIADYLGIPPKVAGAGVNAMPFRSYALICDQWFRSEAVMNPVHVFVDDENRIGSNGDDQVNDIELGGKPFIACKFFDYFTSGLPSPQRGSAANVFPAGAVAPVVPFSEALQDKLGIDHPFRAGSNYPYSNTTFGIYDPYDKEWYKTTSNAGYAFGMANEYDSNNDPVSGLLHFNASSEYAEDAFVGLNNLFAELPLSTFDINDLRQAFAIQRYLERSARFGGRYQEFIYGFFGVTSPDARLQRTEYLGGSRISLNINQVTQTSSTQSGTTPLGNVAGMSVTGDTNSDFTYSCTEHGYIMGIAVLRYHHSYQQGINRVWSRRSFFDYYLPTFAYLGEQNILLRELYYNDSSPEEDETFAYQERWSEYRYLPNRISGELRSVADNSLDMWHLGDYYTEPPVLSPEWLREDKTMLDRALAVTSDVANQCICDFFIEVEASRPLPLYSIPGLIDHN